MSPSKASSGLRVADRCAETYAGERVPTENGSQQIPELFPAASSNEKFCPGVISCQET